MIPLLLLAQVISITGGASTLLNADGGSATLYMPGSTSSVSAGVSNGALVAGASTRFKLERWDLYAGDRQLFLQAGSDGLALSARGVSVERKGEGGSLVL